MCRLAHSVNFTGQYLVRDLDHFSMLQEYYLGSMGYSPTSLERIMEDGAGVALVPGSQWTVGGSQLDQTAKPRLLLATWSLSETPIEVREQVLSESRDFDFFLIGYQDSFGEMDNHTYFSDLAKSWRHVQWTQERIAFMPYNNYLFGRRRDTSP